MKEERLIDFEKLCLNCRYNGDNHQEAFRLCPAPADCLANPDRKKGLKTCPIWKDMKRG